MTKEKKHELYYDRKEQGLCVDCGKSNDNGKVRCDECLGYHRYANAKFRCNATEEWLRNRSEYSEKWRKAHKSKSSDYYKQWAKNHSEELKERRKEYNRRYREKQKGGTE